MKYTMCFLAVASSISCMNSANAEEFTGIVIKVYDGDTAHVRKDNGTVEKIRFRYCDTPEIRQAHGPQARDFVKAMILDKEVTVKWDRRDDYGRIVGEILLGDVSVNLKVIEEGHGWWFYHYNSDIEIGNLEIKARSLKKGLWAARSPLYPRAWRAGARINGSVNNGGGGAGGTNGGGGNEESESSIQIMALMPNPSGRDENNETVIVANNTEVSVSVDQWQLKDKDGGIFTLSGTIPASGVRTIRLSNSLQLGNSGDKVMLIKAGGQVVQTVSYANARAGRFVMVP